MSHSGSRDRSAGLSANGTVPDMAADVDTGVSEAVDTTGQAEPVVQRSTRDRVPPDRYGQWHYCQNVVEPGEVFV